MENPAPDLKSLEPLIGEWILTGDAKGRVRYEWMEGGHFLLQHFDFDHDGHRVMGIEIIGHLKPFGEEPSPDIHSRVYDSEGNTLDYIYELEGDTLTIWAGAKGSPAYFRGTFNKDRTQNTGEWVFPGGGGYKSTMERATASSHA